MTSPINYSLSFTMQSSTQSPIMGSPSSLDQVLSWLNMVKEESHSYGAKESQDSLSELGKVILDLSALSAEDANLVRSLQGRCCSRSYNKQFAQEVAMTWKRVAQNKQISTTTRAEERCSTPTSPIKLIQVISPMKKEDK
ncbi:MAG: hypothetical protein FJZ58_04575 [Chlamydiae bacterium]|nr:hypothetical protein [Chlamydiota bacterium]